MNAEEDSTQRSRPRVFEVLKFTLYGLLADILLVAVWVLYVMVATVGAGCDGEACTATGFFVSRVVFAFQLGLGLMIYMWVILIPLLAASPVAGFVVDCVRSSRRANDV